MPDPQKPVVTVPSEPEPPIANEESVPSDGKDEVGEKMIEELGRDKGVEQPGHPAPD